MRTNKAIKTTQNFLKRLVDILGGIIGLIILLPLIIFVCILKIKFNEKNGNIFYTQNRIGKNGKQFKMYKFRTMNVNADEELKIVLKNNEKIKEEYNKYKKIRNDPRVTKVGKILRRTNIDEFPQFLNVLKGEMSLVGPRPYLPNEIKDMGKNYNNIILVKPGITGYWQINRNRNTDFEERTKMDVEYVENNNIFKDLKILIKTIVKRGKIELAGTSKDKKNIEQNWNWTNYARSEK